MRSDVAMLRLATYERREHAGLLVEAKRPDLVSHLNAHPEIVDRLLEKAKWNAEHPGSTDEANF